MRQSSYTLFFSFILIFLFPLLSVSQSDPDFDFFHKKLSDSRQGRTLDRYYIETDKSIYKEGDNVWFRINNLKTETGLLSKGNDHVSLSLFKNKGNVIPLIPVEISKGVGAGNFTLPSSMTPGIYQFAIRGKDEIGIDSWPYFIIVKKYLIPDFIINCEYSDEKYVSDDAVDMSIKFHDYYFEPLKNVNYTLKLLDGIKVVFSSKGKSSKSGVVKVLLAIPMNVENDVLKIIVEADYQKKSASIESFIIVSEDLLVDFFPEGGKLIAKLDNKLRLSVHNKYGMPIKTKGVIQDKDHEKDIIEFETDKFGLAKVNITPQVGMEYLAKFQTHEKEPTLFELPVIHEKGIQLSVEKINKSSVLFKLKNTYPSSRKVYMIGKSNGKIFWQTSIEFDSDTTVVADVSNGQGGVLHFSVFNIIKKIESELCIKNPILDDHVVKLELGESDLSTRGKVETIVSSDSKSNDKIHASISVVYDPWYLNEFNFVQKFSLTYPKDMSESILFNQLIVANTSDKELLFNLLVPYYKPKQYSWNSILKPKTNQPGKGGGTLLEETYFRMSLREGYNSYKSVSGGKVNLINANTKQNVMAAANPDYFSTAVSKTAPRPKSYAKMLESGSTVAEVIHRIRPYSLVGSYIVFHGSSRSINTQAGSMIVLDGMQLGMNASILDDIDPFGIETINISTKAIDIQRYSALNCVGLIELTTKVVSINEDLLSDNEYRGRSIFQGERHDQSKRSKENDYRSTIYWNPNFGLENGIKTLDFYNADFLLNVVVRVISISENGNITTEFKGYQVR